LGNVEEIEGVEPSGSPNASHGLMVELSAAKATLAGHWEMMGLVLEDTLPTYPEGFPDDLLLRFENETGRGVLGNRPASGTEIIEELGPEQEETGAWILYTSADSVFQIAAHEQVVPLARLYEICETARRILRGPDEVGRVIARPFTGEAGAFRRTENRHDYAVPPPRENLLVALSEAGHDVVCIGKVASIYDSSGVTEDLTARNNDQSIDQTIRALQEDTRGLIFSNLVDFDMLYGHRRDVEGYARALEHFDSRLPEIEAAMRAGDLFILAADHGNDPTFPGTDHTREYSPLIVYGRRARAGVDLGIRRSLADIGQTIADNFGLTLKAGESFLDAVARGA
ncbi:MAG TPA: phosphopentomutase, partial [Pyrinomonadaceae bacterium]|nr:phosphopentomutase [Pyrinomonadaceae bacterium]